MRLVNISGPPLAPGVRVKNRLGLRKMLLDPFHCQKKQLPRNTPNWRLATKLRFLERMLVFPQGKFFLIQQNCHSRSG
jgi:hypothetical protein